MSSALKVTVDTQASQVVNLPSGLSTNHFTLRRSGVNLQLVNDTTGAVLLNQTIASLSAVQINGADNTAEQLTVDMNYGGAFSLPLGMIFAAGAGSPADVLVVRGTNAATTYTLNGASLVAGGLTINYSGVQGGIQLKGGIGNDDYVLNSSPANVKITDAGGSNTLDFSGDSAGVTLNLGLAKGQAQTIAPWGKTLALQGVFQNLVGTAYADVLTGGTGAGIIRGGAGNDILRAGSGNTVLVGGGGNDTLYGGSGACVLIAGSGVCTLYGGSGRSLLIGGSTSYDANDQALLGLLNELAVSRMVTSRTRIPLASGLTGPYALVVGKTFQDSAQNDTLVKGGGQTWFLPGVADTVKT